MRGFWYKYYAFSLDYREEVHDSRCIVLALSWAIAYIVEIVMGHREVVS